MVVKSFKSWFLETQKVDGECNCWLPEMFDDIITSSKESKINELHEYFKLYFKYVEKQKLETYN